MKLYDEFEDRRDEFEILALHDSSVKSLAELDERLKPTVQRWGRALPFPILLDSTGKTIQNFGVFGFPTTMLIDPEGKLVRRGGLERLRAKLDESR